MAYCTEAEVKKMGGTYLVKTVSPTLSLDYSFYITNICNEIDGWLAEVGVILPIDASYTHALARLKEIACLGVLGQSENAVSFASNPMGSKESRGALWKAEYEEKLGIPKKNDKNNNPIYTGYLQNPKIRLFAGDSLVDAAFNDFQPVRPIGSLIWSYTAEIDNEVGIGMDTKF